MAPSDSDSSSCRRRVSASSCTVIGRRAFEGAEAPCARRSASRTDRPFAAIWCAQLDLPRLRKREQRARVAHVDLAFLHHRLHRRSELEQPQQIGNARARAPDGARDLLVRELEFLDEALQTASPPRSDSGPRAGCSRSARCRAPPRRAPRGSPRECARGSRARRAPAPLAGEDLVLRVVHRPHHDRLDHAARADRFRELVERGFVHARARLVLARTKQRHRQLRERVPRRRDPWRCRPAARRARGPAPCA